MESIALNFRFSLALIALLYINNLTAFAAEKFNYSNLRTNNLIESPTMQLSTDVALGFYTFVKYRGDIENLQLNKPRLEGEVKIKFSYLQYEKFLGHTQLKYEFRDLLPEAAVKVGLNPEGTEGNTLDHWLHLQQELLYYSQKYKASGGVYINTVLPLKRKMDLASGQLGLVAHSSDELGIYSSENTACSFDNIFSKKIGCDETQSYYISLVAKSDIQVGWRYFYTTKESTFDFKLGARIGPKVNYILSKDSNIEFRIFAVANVLGNLFFVSSPSLHVALSKYTLIVGVEPSIVWRINNNLSTSFDYSFSTAANMRNGEYTAIRLIHLFSFNLRYAW